MRLRLGSCLCSFWIAKSCIWPRPGPHPSPAAHQALLSLHPFTLCSKQPFCMELCSFCGPILLSFATLKFEIFFFLCFVFFAQGHQWSWSLEYYFNTSCWGMDLYLWMKRDTFRRHVQSKSERRAPRQSSLSTNWSNPLGFVYLNETLRPRGVCWGEVRNAKYLFFFLLVFFCFLSSAFILAFFFSLPALQLHDPEILGKHPGSAALLSLAASPPFALSSLVPSTVSVTRNFLLSNLSLTIVYSEFLFIFLYVKKKIK